jgi:hypothetical protein
MINNYFQRKLLCKNISNIRNLLNINISLYCVGGSKCHKIGLPKNESICCAYYYRNNSALKQQYVDTHYMCTSHKKRNRVRIMVFNATFNNISVIAYKEE